MATLCSAVLFAGCTEARDYRTENDEDEDYELALMALRDTDFPKGYFSVRGVDFDNQQWADLFGEDEGPPATKITQLEAQGRLRSHVNFFVWASERATTFEEAIIGHLGGPYTFTVASTLYTEEKLAIEATRGLCGTLASDRTPVKEFYVPTIGDQSAGFYSENELGEYGKGYETTVCFRTGRVVHAIVQSGLEGTQDIALSVRLAERMLKRVEAVFDGKAEPLEDDENG